MRLVILAVVGLVLSLAVAGVACGSNGNNNNQGGGGGTDGGVFGDGAQFGDGQGGGHGGDGGANPCPVYQSYCNGKCVSTGDPNNCGGCGVVCAGNQVCSSNACSGSCMPGTTACNHACVDTGSDNANCGGCGHACPSGQGCVEGGCVPSVPLGPPPAKCANGGPPINFGDGGTATCSGQVAQTTFTWALCSCTNVNTSDVLLTDAYDSTKGPYPQPGFLGGGVGLDNQFQASGSVQIGGALWASAASGLNSSSDTAVKEELHVGGPLNAQLFTVGYDGFVNGAVSGSPATFDKDLTVPNGVSPSGTTVKGQIIHVPPPVSVPPPCGCQPSQLIPVGAYVAAFKTNNDNATVGLDPTVLTGPQAPTRLDLPCGVYYLDAITTDVSVTVVAHGNTALVIGGSIAPQSPLTITVDPTASLDLLVGGTISSQDALTIGAINYPALSRTYVGGSAALTFASGTTLGSNLYAAYAHLDWSADSDIYGSVFAGDFSGSSRVAIHYDSAVLSDGQPCGPPPPTCGSCTDCGNQACANGACGKCTSSAQCCAPLICQNGTCVQALQ
jgi:hypothetical protein